VEIILQSSEEKYNEFLQDLKANAPVGSEITNIETEDIKEREFDGFRIIESKDDEEISIIRRTSLSAKAVKGSFSPAPTGAF